MTEQIKLEAHELGALVLQQRWQTAALEEVVAAGAAGRPDLALAIARIANSHECAGADRQVARAAADRILPVITGGQNLSHEKTCEGLRTAAALALAVPVEVPHGG